MTIILQDRLAAWDKVEKHIQNMICKDAEQVEILLVLLYRKLPKLKDPKMLTHVDVAEEIIKELKTFPYSKDRDFAIMHLEENWARGRMVDKLAEKRACRLDKALRMCYNKGIVDERTDRSSNAR